MTVDWVTWAISIGALLLSSISLGLSALTYRRAGRTKRREWRISAGEHAEQISLMLRSVPQRAEFTSRAWQSLFATRGLSRSDAQKQFTHDIDERVAEAKCLDRELDALTEGLERMSEPDIERLLVALSRLQRQAEGILQWFDDKDARRHH